MSLKEYKRKRDFKKTPEPQTGEPLPEAAGLRFVVQKHAATRLHYDLRLEMAGAYKSWAVPRGPSLNPSDQRLAVQVEDHPLDYGDFEGIIPKGNYGAGTVMIWDYGTYLERGSREAEDSSKAMLDGWAKGHMTFILNGTKLKGEFALIRLKDEKSWLLVKKRDKNARIKKSDDVLLLDRSAKSGRNMDEIATLAEGENAVWHSRKVKGGFNPAPQLPDEPPPLATKPQLEKRPHKVAFMQPRLLPELFTGEGWTTVPVYEGLRAIAVAGEGRAHLYSKAWRPFDQRFPELCKSLAGLYEGAVFDGEIVLWHGDGKAEKPKRDKSKTGEAQAVFLVWDLLHWQGENYSKLPLSRRLAVLASLALPAGVRIAPAFAQLDEGVLGELRDCGAQAVLVRYLQSPYRGGVSGFWYKIPLAARDHAVVEANPDTLDELQAVLELKPEPAEVVETVKRKVGQTASPPRLTNPDRVYFPGDGITKGELVEYYRSVAPYLLPHLKDRPESLHRFPHGINKEGFFQKDLQGYHPAWFELCNIYSETAGKSVSYGLCQNENSLLYLANLGCIELNPWLSRVTNLDNPDFTVIDLDPDKHSFAEVVAVARTFKGLCDELDLPTYVKTSGARGIHVCIPLGGRYSYDVSRLFAKALCEALQRRLAATTTLERNPARRGGKIYLDHLQNRRSQTLAAPYGVRPRPGAPVSTPLSWDELDVKLSPGQFHLRNTLKRLEAVGDLWQPVLGPGIDVAAFFPGLRQLAD